jgi:hypothetical protein
VVIALPGRNAERSSCTLIPSTGGAGCAWPRRATMLTIMTAVAFIVTVVVFAMFDQVD